MKETRGRKPKKHAPINASFSEVLGAIAKSKYTDKPKPTDRHKKEK